MLTTTLTLLLLTLGPVLAAFGVAGFLGNWSGQAPDHDSLRYVQTLATTGRRMAYAGLALYLLHHGLPVGDTLTALLCVAGIALATYLTATSNTIVPTGATP
jgi:predicted MFS family arabinose efflux permease